VVHSSSEQQGRNTALKDARRHIKGLKRRRKRMPKKISKEEWEQRIRDAGAGRYEFVGWRECEDAIKAMSRVIVMCNADGFEWDSSVNNLVNHGRGCPRCARNVWFTAEDRVDQINSLENILFLSWVDGYKNSYSKANVRCSLDGFVWRTAVGSLVNGWHGCPQCAKTGYDQCKTGTLYALRSECGRYVKIGISNDPKRRHNELEKRTPFKFNIVEQISGDGAKIAELEKYFHSKYERAGFARFDGCTEWLICTPQLLEELRELAEENAKEDKQVTIRS